MIRLTEKQIYMLVVGGIVLFLLCGLVAMLPPISERLAWHFAEWRVQLRYFFDPPQEEIFVPDEQVATIVYLTLMSDSYLLTQQPYTPEETPQPVSSEAASQPTIVSSPTSTSTPLPDSVVLSGVRYEDQHGLWNYCAPANLAMALSYWGWEGDRLDTGHYLKPFDDDKNVMPYEMENYVVDETNLAVIFRYGGTEKLIKSLIAEGFPVLVETGVYIRSVSTGRVNWTGHYTIITGYNDADQYFITQDSYYEPDYPVTYDQLEKEWRSFNYVFLVVYPPEEQDRLYNVLGTYLDSVTSARIALEYARSEAQTLTEADRFFVLFNQGTSLVQLQDYIGASAAYDDAFRYYASVPSDIRPWRMLWYQTGPYFAYYYTGRYQDVINLADQTLDISDPYLEESYYWRARAKLALGDREGAVEDLQESLKLHEGFIPSVDLLETIGE